MDFSEDFTGGACLASFQEEEFAFESHGEADPAFEAELAPVIPLLSPVEIGEAFGEQFQRLTAVAVRITRNPSDAEDVVQNAFLKALKNRHQFRGDSKLSTWLHRIVTNEALMWLRSRKRHTAEPEEMIEHHSIEIEPVPTAEDEIRSKRERRRVRDAIGLLNEEDAAILERCAIGEQSYASFGESHGLHPAAVKTRAFRARRKLRKILESGEPSQVAVS